MRGKSIIPPDELAEHFYLHNFSVCFFQPSLKREGEQQKEEL